MDEDEIRRKRLARLGGRGGQHNNNTTVAALVKEESSGESSGAAVKQEKKPLMALPEILPAHPVRKSPPSISRKAMALASPADAATPVTPVSKNNNAAAANFAAMSDQLWEHTISESVLGVSLEAPPSSKSLLYLELLAEELRAEDAMDATVMSADKWERIIYARMSLDLNADVKMPSVFEYLVAVWLKLHLRFTNLLKLAQDNSALKEIALRRSAKLSEFSTVVLNYVGLVINPETIDMFPQNHQYGAGIFGVKLLANPDPESAFPRHFMDAFIQRFAEEGLSEIFSATMKSVLTFMRSKRIYDDYMNAFRVLMYLISFKWFADKITLLPEWMSPGATTPRLLESMTLLGTLLSRLAIFPDADVSIPTKYFGSNGDVMDATFDAVTGVGGRNYGDVKSAKASLRDASKLAQSYLHGFILALIKANPIAKEKVLEFFAIAINSNQKRGRIQVDRNEVSTDGFMQNLQEVSKILCAPLMDPTFSKIGLIDPFYLFYSQRLDFAEETRVIADKEMNAEIVSRWKAAQPQVIPPANFVTEIFFATASLHHFGIMSTLRFYKTFTKELEEMQVQHSQFITQRDAGEWAKLPPLVQRNYEAGLARFQGEMNKLVGVRIAMESALLDEVMLEDTIRFYDLVMLFLVKCASGAKGTPVPWSRVMQGELMGLSLFPLSETMPDEYTTLPEWLIDDVCDFYKFLMRRKAPIFENKARDIFFTFSMVFLSNPAYIKNPYLKSKLVEILYQFTHPLWKMRNGETRGKLDGPFFSHKFVKSQLIPAILKFYVDVEQTGMHSQFYDKFNIRYHISQILKDVWNDSNHHQQIVSLSRKDTDFFVKFVNLLMNDTTFLLDEALSKLKDIIQLKIDLAGTELSAEDRTSKEKNLQQSERSAESYCSLGNETVAMLSFLTGDPEIVPPFMADEVVVRLAAMLDFNLVALAGPRCTQLKVPNPEKYRFEPRLLLSAIIDIFLHLAPRKEFVAAVAKDGRSYGKEVFVQAANLISKHNMKGEGDVTAFLQFVDRVEAIKKNELLQDEELGEVPDEFLDPLMAEIMEDPVLLPSGQNIDRSNLLTHLLSYSTDPFNRQPLTINDVVPNTELKERIAAWKKGKKAEKE